ncbi:MAG TPA: three component ABC system middle component [Flavobacterium sp.]|uniref:three component ABC system middle component n=1 Tax=Flavobacterium sp. TaxID=239 RepID=UPI002ED123BB
MSKIIENLDALYNNPFLLTPIIVRFYEKYEGKQQKDFLLSYLVLPIVLYEGSKSSLLTKKKELRTFINYSQKKDIEKNKLEIKKNEKLFGLPLRVEEYKEITNICLQYAFDLGCLQLNEDLSIKFLEYKFKKDNSLVENLKVAENFAVVLKKEKITHVFMRLGIKRI